MVILARHILPDQALFSEFYYLETTLRNTVIISAFEKSIKNAPTIGTTRKLFGAQPYRSVSALMLATAFGVIPSPNPMCPLAATAAS